MTLYCDGPTHGENRREGVRYFIAPEGGTSREVILCPEHREKTSIGEALAWSRSGVQLRRGKKMTGTSMDRLLSIKKPT
jgi:hypothetical protein